MEDKLKTIHIMNIHTTRKKNHYWVSKKLLPIKNNTYKITTLLSFLLLNYYTIYGQQVIVSGAHASSNGSFSTLEAAFGAINAQTQTANNIQVEVDGSTTESATAVLNNGAWSSLIIYPTSTGIVVEGSLSAPLISLDGASNVTIDGRVGGQSSGAAYGLVFRNTQTASTAGTSTLCLINGASSNVIKHTRLEGSAMSTTSGTVYFATSTASTGNDHNVLVKNWITHAASARPVNSVFSEGSATKPNTGNTIRDNVLMDFFTPSANSQGILLQANNENWTIRGNSFYETNTFSPSSTYIYAAVFINHTGVNGTVICGNFIGGTTANAGGSMFTKSNSSNNVFYGFRINSGNATATQLDSNLMQSIHWVNNNGSNWFGISIDQGLVDIGLLHGNTIGRSSAAITLSNTVTSGVSNLYGIYLNGNARIRIRHNSIGNLNVTTAVNGSNLYGVFVNATAAVDVDSNQLYSLTCAPSTGGISANLYGIFKSATIGDLNVRGNTIGSTSVSNSLHLTSATGSTSQDLFGVLNNGLDSITISGNIIANLTNSFANHAALIKGISSSNGINIIQQNVIHDLRTSNNTSGLSVMGIEVAGASVKNIQSNTIFNLFNNLTDSRAIIYGIYFTGGITGANNGIFNNFIHSLDFPNNTGTIAGTIYGIFDAGSPIVANNIVTITTTKTATIYGAWVNVVGGSPARKYYYNTFYVGGAATAGAAPSFAMYSNHIFNKQYFNNIFVNEKSGGTGKHCVIRLARVDGTLIDHNTYFAGSSAVMAMLGAVDYTTLPAWRSITFQDIASVSSDPQFALNGGTNASDYIPIATHLIGSPDLDILHDFAGSTRQYFTQGAYEVVTDAVVTVNSSTGVSTANYGSLTRAFAAINNGTHTGAIEVVIKKSHPLIQSALLLGSGTGAASYSNIHVFPSETGIIVQSTALNHLIDLDGASNVQIDGRVGGNVSGASFALTLINNTNDNTGRSAIRLINGASGNTVMFTILKAGFLQDGIIFVSTSTASTGNDNNIFVQNKLTNAHGIRPLVGLMALGTAGKNNTGNVFRDNEVFDILRPTCQDVTLSNYNDNWIIRGNSFYETNTLSVTGTTPYTIIHIGRIEVNNTVVLGNFIGGSEAKAGGTPLTKLNTQSNVFYGIRVQAANTTTHVDSNIIQNIHWTNSLSSDFYAIALGVVGFTDIVNVNIGLVYGNKIGGTGASIDFINANGGNSFFGIFLNGIGDCKVKNNHLQNIDVRAVNLFGIYATNGDGTPRGVGNIEIDTNIIENFRTSAANTTGLSNIYGIYKYVPEPIAGKTFNVRGNTIGSTSVANSFHATSISSSSAQSVYGIYLFGNGTKNVSNNIVANLTNENTNATVSTNGRVNGIYVFSTASITHNLVHDLSIANASTLTGLNASVSGIALQGGDTVRGNTVFNLQNTRTDFEGNIQGIITYFFPGHIEKNTIHSLSAPNNNSSAIANIFGIHNMNVNETKVLFNNIVVLKGSETVRLYGIFETGTGGTTNVYHNTIYIGGAAASGAAESFALWNNVVFARNYRNNIFVNERTGGSGSHYAIRLAGITSLGIDCNTYFVGSNGVLGKIVSTDYTSLASWQSATTQDANSKDADPLFAVAGGLLPANYIPASQNLLGNPYLNISQDFAGLSRQYFSMGAHEVFVAQGIVNVNATVGVSSAGYFDLIQAFTSINNGSHRGIIEVVVNQSHTLSSTASLLASATGPSDYTSIRLFPSATSLVVSGNILNAPLIDLNGARNVCLDGRVGGLVNGAAFALTFRNTTQHQGVGTSTLRFWNGASVDTVSFMRMEGSSLASLSGTILFATSTEASGNNNNILYHNQITNAGGLRPFNSVFSLGTAAKPNSNNQVLHNEFFDFIPNNSASNGVHLNENNENWSIVGNSFYEKSTYVPSASGAHTMIFVNHTGINGTLIRANFIGGTEAYALGTPLVKTNAQNNILYGIRVNAGSTLATQIDSNYIGNMDWANSTGSHWYGIDVMAGKVDIGLNFGNHIGGVNAAINCSNTTLVIGIHLAGTSDIRVRNNSISNIHVLTTVSGSTLYGIRASATGNIDLDTNVIQNLSTNSTDNRIAVNLFGIQKNGTSGILNIRGNTIGSVSVANSLHAISESTDANLWQAVYGIQNIGSGTINILHNTIANVTNATTNTGNNTGQVNVVNGIYSTNGVNWIEGNTILNLSNANANTTFNQFASVGGIVLITTTAKTVRNNTIAGLKNVRSDFNGYIYGIYFTGATGANNGVYGNFVHSLEVPNNTSTTAAHLYGIRHISSGITTVANNIVMLKGDQTANLFGLYDDGTSGTSNYYHNTVYLAGTTSTGSAPSYAFWSNATAAIQDFRNNIFANQRTGGSGIHYAIRLAGTTTLTINNNLYYVGGSGQVGNLSSNRATLANWRTATSQDQNSVDVDPIFAQAGSVNANGYLPAAAALRGISDLMDSDFNQNNRIYDAIGAFDFPVFIQWVGGVGANPTDWNDRLNWLPDAAVPAANDIIGLMDNSNGHPLVLDQNRTVKTLCFNAADKKVVLGNFNLTVTDTLTLFDASNYVQTNGTGKLIKQVGSGKSFFFSIGNASYNPVRIYNHTDATDGFALRVLNEVKNSGLVGRLNMDERVDITWDISKNSGSSNNQNGVDMEFFWQTANEVSSRSGNGFNVAALNYFNAAQNTWEIATTGNSNYTPGQQSLLHTGYKGTFSPFAIGGSELTPLPLTLASFEANIVSTYPKKCMIMWQTVAETNLSHFELEWSSDCEHWIQIATLRAAGNSQELIAYEFEHDFPKVENFYRLRSVDLDGDHALSPIRNVTFESQNDLPNIILYPNPTSHDFSLQTVGIENAHYEVFDNIGKSVCKGFFKNKIVLGDFTAGVYHVMLSLGNHVIIKKVVVTND